MLLHTFQELKTIFGWTQINVIVLAGLPEPLDPNVIQRSALAIHRDELGYGSGTNLHLLADSTNKAIDAFSEINNVGKSLVESLQRILLNISSSIDSLKGYSKELLDTGNL